MAKNKKESFFWTSYSDLMTSLFFIMLVLFVIVIVVMQKRMEATELQLQEIKKIEASTKELSDNGKFVYRPDYKKYVLKIEGKYPDRESDITKIIAEDKAAMLDNIADAGMEIHNFLLRHSETQYILIIEGQASRDNYSKNYELSYERALGLLKFWMLDRGITFGENCEIQISGSGDGKLETRSIREPVEKDNQRFLIYILPKNIFDNEKE